MCAMCVSKNCPTPPAGPRRDAAAAVCTVFARKLQAGCWPLSAERLVANISAAAGRGAGVRQLCKYCGGRGGGSTTTSPARCSGHHRMTWGLLLQWRQSKRTTGVTNFEKWVRDSSEAKTWSRGHQLQADHLGWAWQCRVWLL